MKALALLFILIVSPLTFAQDQNVNYAEFEQYVEKLMKEFNVPGMAVGIVSKSGPIYMKGFGVRGVDEKLPVTPQTQFAIGSTSKAFTATSLGILVDQNVVQWDKPVKESYLPDFEMLDPVATNLVTIRDLLTHRTGLPRHDLVWYGTPFSREELYHRVKYLTPTASLREKVQYQNIMYMVAGYLVERVTKTSWDSFVRTNIFEKIGMKNSTFNVQDMQKSADFAYPHSNAAGKIVQIPFRNIDAVAPAGAINSSVSDMGRWLQLQLNHGQFDGKQVVSASTLNEIHSPQMVSHLLGFDNRFEEFGAETYALGWMVQPYLNKKLIHHGGGIDGFITFVGFLPEMDIGIVVFGNTGGFVPYITAFGYLDLLIKGKIGPWEERLKALMTPPTPVFADPSKAPLPLEHYAGVYTHPAYGKITVTKTADAEQLDFAHYVLAFKLGHYQNHSFLPITLDNKLDKSTDPIQFVAEGDGTVSGFYFKADEVADPILFTREKTASIKALPRRPNVMNALEPLDLF